jgi:arabinan endo-1,5-alpha-L-arabinosidase
MRIHSRTRHVGRLRIGLLGLAVLALVAWALSATRPLSSSAVHLTADSAASSVTGNIMSNLDSGDCVDVTGNSSADDAVVEMWGCNGGASQVWTFETDGTVQHAGKCLDIYQNSTANGALIDQYTCTGSANQRWTQTGSTLVNPATGKCLDDPGSNTAEGTQLDLWTCDGGENQSWTFGGSTSSGGTTLTSVPDDLGTHDPSRVIDDDGTYVFWGTGGGGWYSTDGKNWKSAPNIFPNGLPSEVQSAVPDNDGVWAPDVIYNPNSGLYDLYYAVAVWGNSDYSLIGLITSPTVNPTSPDYHWTDRGIVIEHTPTYGEFSAIDPAPFFDPQGNMWMSFGSGYASYESTSLNIISLNKDTGLRSGTSDYVVGSGHAEATYVAYHDGYYYLFWNTGGCCSGASSTYEVHVARSTSVTGPYGTSQIFIESSSTQHGPGQIGILDQNGTDYYSYHYYPDSGGSVLGYHILTWASSGWPESGQTT